MNPVGIITERVEPIPAARLWGSLLRKCGRLNPFFMWQESLEVFLKYYTPCQTVEDSTQQFTTPQLINMLEQHSGCQIPPEDLNALLTERGFIYEYTQELMFEWLFKART